MVINIQNKTFTGDARHGKYQGHARLISCAAWLAFRSVYRELIH